MTSVTIRFALFLLARLRLIVTVTARQNMLLGFQFWPPLFDKVETQMEMMIIYYL